MFEVSTEEVARLFADAHAYAQNGFFDEASMTAEQAQEMWEEIRPPDSEEQPA